MSSSKMNISSLLSPQPPDPPPRTSSAQPSQSGTPQQIYASPQGGVVKGGRQELGTTQRATSYQNGRPDVFHHFSFDGSSEISNNLAPMAPSSRGYNGLQEGSGRQTTGLMRSPALESRNTPGVAPQPSLLHRPSQTEKMEFLADIASMQHHQQSLRPDAQSHRHYSESQEAGRSPSVSRRPSLIPTAGDHPMSHAPTATTIENRAFRATSLSQEDLGTISELIQQLKENSYLYESHVRLINLLHQGFVSHICPPDAPEILGDPLQYPLLRDLRQAREAMDSRFPVGEDLWLDWLQDECMLATSIADRVGVMELCQKAVRDEVGSSKIWRLYGDWMWFLHKSSISSTVNYEHNTLEHHALVGMILANQSWSEEDKQVGPEVFDWDTMMNVWVQGAQASAWHINDSHLVWQPYLEILTNDLYRSPTPEKLQHVGRLLTQRLQQPHASWDETFQVFSQYVTKYNNASYEDIMIETSRLASASKQDLELRADFEFRLLNAAEVQDKAAEWTALSEYLDWEALESKKRNASKSAFELRTALHERANLRFPNDIEFWEDHIDLAQDNQSYNYASLSILERATRHCPWSGTLWSRRLLALEAANKEFSELEEVKHHATSTGLLEELGGIEELIKVHTSWCGFLRRRAYGPDSGEDERDVAEVGILSALEDIRAIGEKKFGKEFKGDPQFRPEKIYLLFLMQGLRLDEARKFYDRLATTHGDLHEFWDRYYLFEMLCWASQSQPGAPAGHSATAPELATAVLQSAIRRPNLDWPEKMIQAYLHHCAQFESIAKVQEAQSEARRATNVVVKRRAQEAADAAGTTDQFASAQEVATVDTESNAVGRNSAAKRKRGSESYADESVSPKRVRESEESNSHAIAGDVPASATSQVKRDRENTTVLVKHLPSTTTETKVRQFFRDCGKILSFNLVPDDHGETYTATLELESKEDVLAAQTKGMKTFDGHSIEIQVGTGTTVWVTNYPPEADEAYICDLFKQFGDIVEVRFPSLKLNTHRRFCYVQFLTSRQAQAATQLDGKAMGGKLILNAKVSDPSARKGRQGAMHEGREVYVGNVDWTASEDDVKALFEQYGTVESVRIPRNMIGKSRGTAFVVFTTKKAAAAALDMNLKEYKSRILVVSASIPNAKGSKRVTSMLIDNQNESGSQGAAIDGDGRSMSANSPAADSATGENNRPQAKDHRSRTLGLLNVPDTVNDARVRTIMEKYGPLRKIVLRPDHGGAIVEFENIADVGKAELGIAGFEIIPGQKLGVGSVAELLREREQVREPVLQPAHAVKRPGQSGGARRGGRGGLGFKRVEGANGSRAPPKDGKSNADFRALINKQ